MRVAALAALFAAVTCGQTQNQVFSLSQTDTPQQGQEVVNALRMIDDLSQVSADFQARTVTASGTADQMLLAAWLVKLLETPGSGKQEYTVPGVVDDNRRGSGGQVRVIYLSQTLNPRDIQELVNAIRTVSDIAKIYQVNKVHAIAMRATADHIAAAEWIVSMLDRQPGAAASVATFTAAGVLPPDTTAVRVFYQPEATSEEDLKQSSGAIRSQTRALRVYPVFFPRAIVLRGTTVQASQAESMIAKH